MKKYLFLIFGFIFLFVFNTNNAKAYTIYGNLDEQKIHTVFDSIFKTYDIEQHPYIYCDNFSSSDFSTNNTFDRITRCYALEKTFLPNFSPQTGTHNYTSTNGTTYSFYYFFYNHTTNSVIEASFLRGVTGFWNFFKTNTNSTFYSNFDFKELTAEENSQYNVLDFSSFSSSGGNTGGNNLFTVYTDSNFTIDEEVIFNTFKLTHSDFSLNEFPYIKCDYRHSDNQKVYCNAITQELFDNLILYHNSYGNASWKNHEVTTSSVGFTYDIVNNKLSTGKRINEVFKYYESSVVVYSLAYSNSYEKSYTNYNISTLPGMSSDYDTKVNKLDFSQYEVNLQFDENLFANDENFKKVCVNSNSSFSITKNHDDGVMSGSDHDFIWFPYGIRGIKQFNYSTEMSNGYYEFEDPYENFYFSSIDNINAIWNTEYMQDNFESKGYTDKYKYYGYTAYLFLHWYNFNNGQTYNFFPIFEVTDNVTTTHISSSGNEHGGGGTRLDGDEEIEISDQYCFYIKNEYEVNEVILDEWGDHYVSVNTPNGPINYSTTINKDKTDSESFLSQPIKFISEMSGTITFLNAIIYNFYMSMPLVVRTFLITALIIFIVMLIMKIGGYK